MIDPVRQEVIALAHTVVVKVGTNVLAGADGRLAPARLQAPLLILLTVVDGLYGSDPRTDPDARLLTTVPLIDGPVMNMAGSSQSSLGTGGMRSKIRAARLATAAGESVIMANGLAPDIL